MPHVSGAIYIWEVTHNLGQITDYVYTQDEKIEEALERAQYLFQNVQSIKFSSVAL